MTGLKYEEIAPIDKKLAARLLMSRDPENVMNGLLRAAYFVNDWRWVQNQCLRFLVSSNADVREVAVVCLGHVARIHRKIDVEVAGELSRLQNDESIGGVVQDALEDIETFVSKE